MGCFVLPGSNSEQPGQYRRALHSDFAREVPPCLGVLKAQMYGQCAGDYIMGIEPTNMEVPLGI